MRDALVKGCRGVVRACAEHDRGCGANHAIHIQRQLEAAGRGTAHINQLAFIDDRHIAAHALRAHAQAGTGLRASDIGQFGARAIQDRTASCERNVTRVGDQAREHHIATRDHGHVADCCEHHPVAHFNATTQGTQVHGVGRKILRDQQVAAEQHHAQASRAADAPRTQHHSATGYGVKLIGAQPCTSRVAGACDLAGAHVKIVVGLTNGQRLQGHGAVGLDVPSPILPGLRHRNIAQKTTSSQAHLRIGASGQDAGDVHVLSRRQLHREACQDAGVVRHAQGTGSHRHAHIGGRNAVAQLQ